MHRFWSYTELSYGFRVRHRLLVIYQQQEGSVGNSFKTLHLPLADKQLLSFPCFKAPHAIPVLTFVLLIVCFRRRPTLLFGGVKSPAGVTGLLNDEIETKCYRLPSNFEDAVPMELPVNLQWCG